MKWRILFFYLLWVNAVKCQTSNQKMGFLFNSGFKQSKPNINVSPFPISIIGTNHKIGILKSFVKGNKLTASINVNLFHKPINYSSSELGYTSYSGAKFYENKANVELESCSLFNLFNGFFFLKTGFYFGYNSFPNMNGKEILWGNNYSNNYQYTFKRGPEAGFILGNLIAFKLGKQTKLTFDYDFRYGGISINNCTVETKATIENFNLKGRMLYFTSNVGIWYQLK
jgi:hypothetical protein